MSESVERMPQIEIGTATPEDARAIADVHYKTWLATFPNKELGITEDDVRDYFGDPYAEDKLKEIAASITNPMWGTQLVARVSGKVVGVCRVSKGNERNTVHT